MPGSSKSETKDAVRKVGAELKSDLKQQAGAIGDRAAEAIGDTQAQAAQARTAASALRETAAGLDGELPWMQTALLKTAEGLESLTSAMNSDIDDVLEAVKGFARRQPALFLGLSVAAGFALTRVGKTAIEEVQSADPAPTAEGSHPSAATPAM
jgi:hypothetical protein